MKVLPKSFVKDTFKPIEEVLEGSSKPGDTVGVEVKMPMSHRWPRVLGKPGIGHLRSVILPLLILVLWQLVVTEGLIASTLFPAPGTVLKALLDWIHTTNGAARPFSGTWAESALASTERVLIGFAVGTLGGLILGVLVGAWRGWHAYLDPLLQGLRPIPVTAWLPLAVIWFGISEKPAVFLVAIGAFFPVYINTVHGVSHVPELYYRAGQMLGVSRRRMLFRIVLPAASPVIAAGMRIGLGFAWMVVIVAEMLAVKSGLGYVLWDSYYFANIDLVIAAMASIGLLGFLSDRLLIVLLRPRLRWAEEGENR